MNIDVKQIAKLMLLQAGTGTDLCSYTRHVFCTSILLSTNSRLPWSISWTSGQAIILLSHAPLPTSWRTKTPLKVFCPQNDTQWANVTDSHILHSGSKARMACLPAAIFMWDTICLNCHNSLLHEQSKYRCEWSATPKGVSATILHSNVTSS